MTAGNRFWGICRPDWPSEISCEATIVMLRSGKKYLASFHKNLNVMKANLKHNCNIVVKGISTINLLYVLINLLDCANYECPGEERVCLLESERCNTVEDCQDRSDELNCGKKINLMKIHTSFFEYLMHCFHALLEFFWRCTKINGVKNDQNGFLDFVRTW